ncbi:MAG: 5-methyltetrahydropteroyltriglutamate--homocysteine methyltransferase, partial [Rhodospirillaceae bacterium]|nr:5-methyltetrahydropteroyltriglutamate--homocysteine methyltransferase [Rhodospirillaceae bacterium]
VKARPEVYQGLAEAVDASLIDAVSIEDAHQHNDLSLLEKFANTTVIFGAVEVASSRIEEVDEIADRLRKALDHIDAERLIAAPDCGLIMLGGELARAKLAKLVEAARLV